ncbi:MAG TPA: TetR/AcrR family transcriptional regulator [Ktedonobacteraceae bacterium]
MASQRTSEGSRTKEHSRREQREQRAERILDAAAELMLRWGYNKTTIDDIVRAAGVPKGTIYLHWKTREDLFLALMEREYARLIQDTQQRIASDPNGGTMQGITKHAMLATMKSPLMKAVLLRDTDLVGEWLHKEYASASFVQQIAQPLALLEHYQAHGIVRDDIDVRQMVYMLKAISIGLLVIDQYMPGDFKYSDEEIAEMTAEVIQRTFVPSSPSDSQPDKKAKQELANNFIASLDNVLAIRNRRDQEEETS